MDLNEFKASLKGEMPPDGVGHALRALWHQAHGEWDRAHELVQPHEDESGAWVHAHLHRERGEESNAGYWYRRAGRPHARTPLNEEWDEIAGVLLSKRTVGEGDA
jgi:hypothetical protein